MSSKNPLDKSFGVHEERLLEDDGVTLTIPDKIEERNLDLIIDFALKAYKEQMEDLQFIEPKNRVRYLEVSERFLNQAKDAMAKKEKLRLDATKSPAKSPQKGTQEDLEENMDDGEGVSRKELQERIRAVK